MHSTLVQYLGLHAFSPCALGLWSSRLRFNFCFYLDGTVQAAEGRGAETSEAAQLYNMRRCEQSIRVC